MVGDQSSIQSAFSESLMERAIAMVRTMGRRHRDEKLLPHRTHSLVALSSQLFVSTKSSMYTIKCSTTLENYVRIEDAKKVEKCWAEKIPFPTKQHTINGISCSKQK